MAMLIQLCSKKSDPHRCGSEGVVEKEADKYRVKRIEKEKRKEKQT